MVKPCAKELKCDVEVGPDSYFLWPEFSLNSNILLPLLSFFFLFGTSGITLTSNLVLINVEPSPFLFALCIIM